MALRKKNSGLELLVMMACLKEASQAKRHQTAQFNQKRQKGGTFTCRLVSNENGWPVLKKVDLEFAGALLTG
ncbi:MAG: hypothetical protein FWC60_09150 [Firmicutes bacterium]|nr:hypothetical protein [Bacillota bacterium]